MTRARAGAGVATRADVAAEAEVRGAAGAGAASVVVDGSAAASGLDPSPGVALAVADGDALAAAVIGLTEEAALVVTPGVGGVRTIATMKNTGANTSAATDRCRLSAIPFRHRRTDRMAGMIAARHSRPPSGAVAGMHASTAPTATTMNVMAPRRFRADGASAAVIGDPLSSDQSDLLFGRRLRGVIAD